MYNLFSIDFQLTKVTGVEKVMLDIHRAVKDDYCAKIVGNIPFNKVRSEHMINARLNGEADQLKRRYEIDELQEEIADELKDKKTKRKGRGRRFK